MKPFLQRPRPHPFLLQLLRTLQVFRQPSSSRPSSACRSCSYAVDFDVVCFLAWVAMTKAKPAKPRATTIQMMSGNSSISSSYSQVTSSESAPVVSTTKVEMPFRADGNNGLQVRVASPAWYMYHVKGTSLDSPAVKLTTRLYQRLRHRCSTKCSRLKHPHHRCLRR